MSQNIISQWKDDKPLYVRNLFTWAPTIFFNTGMIVDSDGRIHPSNIGLSGNLDHVLDQTTIGTLDHPPTLQEIQDSSKKIPQIISQNTPENILISTQRADQELTRFCKTLWPHYRRKKEIEMKKKRSNTTSQNYI
jgi:hypothetical protein